MKKIIKGFISILTSLALMLPITVYAAGDPNIESGGGGLSNVTSSYYWNETYEGVRVTLVNATTGVQVRNSFDMSNINCSVVDGHFGEVSKTSYKNGYTLTQHWGDYQSYQPTSSLPRIIACSSYSSSVEAIRSYFTDEAVLQWIAGKFGIEYEEMIGGEYKLMVEPVAFIHYDTITIAMTATEAALFDLQTGGNVRRYFGSLSNMNLPFAIYLSRDDLGYTAWTGSTTSQVDDSTIINNLGVGIVRFTDDYTETPYTTITNPDYIYRTDTDVITSVYVGGSTQADPDNSVTVNFNILGTNYRVTNVYYPANGSQLVWVKWHTPSTPQNITISVSSGSGVRISDSSISCSIVDLTESTPPDPTADDRNDSYNSSAAVYTAQTERTSAAWTRWGAYWHENWVWHQHWVWHSTGHTSSCRRNCTTRHGYWHDDGEYQDDGWWVFYQTTFYANLSATENLTPDDMDPTAYGDVIKSGYGVNEEVSTTMYAWYYYTDGSGSQQIQNITYSGMITAAQNAQSRFPEFYYQTYWRNLERTTNGYSNTMEFKSNPYSTYGNRTHFTPVWMKDGTYTVHTWVFDAWTPAGMLSTNVSDSVQISGNLWSDWHIAPVDPD